PARRQLLEVAAVQPPQLRSLLGGRHRGVAFRGGEESHLTDHVSRIQVVDGRTIDRDPQTAVGQDVHRVTRLALPDDYRVGGYLDWLHEASQRGQLLRFQTLEERQVTQKPNHVLIRSWQTIS